MALRRRHALFAAAVSTGVGTSFFVPISAVPADPALARLVLFVAMIQAAACLGALAVALWRLRAPGPAAAYAFSIGVATTGPGLVAGGHALGGAICFWGGMALAVVTAVVDRAGWRQAIARWRQNLNSKGR